MIILSNSPLVNYTKISPNKTSPRNHVIDTITIHCVVGQCAVETLGNIFASPSKKASSNYGIGYDGRIGMYVEEKDRSWCSSSSSNDNRAITIEVASDTTHPYAVKDAAYKSLINLLVDICQRNNIKELKWKADKSLIGHPEQQNMTVHRWFANKSCPGDYLYNRHGQIAAEVNALLGKIETDTPTEPVKPVDPTPTEDEGYAFKIGDLISLTNDAVYYNGTNVPKWVKNKKWYVKSISGSRAIIDKSDDGENAINSPIHVKYLRLAKSSNTSIENNNNTNVPYLVEVDINNLNIRRGPGMNYSTVGAYTGKGVFTIVEVSAGNGSNSGWGRLKSGAGWISLDFTKRV